ARSSRRRRDDVARAAPGLPGQRHSRRRGRSCGPRVRPRIGASLQTRHDSRIRESHGALMRKLTANVNPEERERITLAEAEVMLPTPDGKRSTAVFEHGTLQVKLYAPRGSDPQQPHTRDEAYVVARGAGWFVNGAHR